MYNYIPYKNIKYPISNNKYIQISQIGAIDVQFSTYVFRSLFFMKDLVRLHEHKYVYMYKNACVQIGNYRDKPTRYMFNKRNLKSH